MKTGKQLRTWRPGGVIAGLAFSPDGARLYTGGNNGYVHEFDSAGKTVQAWTTAGQGVARTLSISPDGRTLAVSTERGVARLWELASLRQRRTFRADSGFAWGVAFAPDGRSVATGGDEGVVRLWDVTAGWAEPDAEKKKPPTDKQLEAYWKDLGGEADAAFTAVWALAAHGKLSVPFLAKKVEGVKPPLTAKQIAKLIEQLDDDDFDERQKASEELAKGGATVPPGAARGDEEPADSGAEAPDGEVAGRSAGRRAVVERGSAGGTRRRCWGRSTAPTPASYWIGWRSCAGSGR